MNKILNKLQKLINHAESARSIGNIAEAEAFSERIQQLLDKHNLSMSDVELSAAESAPLGSSAFQSIDGKFEIWQQILHQTICRLNGCESLTTEKFNFLIFIGRENDILTAKLLFAYFDRLGRELGENYKYQNKYVIASDFARLSLATFLVNAERSEREINSYLLGFATSVADRLKDQHKKSSEEFAGSTALVRLDYRQSEAKKFAQEQFQPGQNNANVSDSLDFSAYIAGLNKGNQIALTNKVIEK